MCSKVTIYRVKNLYIILQLYEPYEQETTEPTNNDIITNEIGMISKLN